MHRALLLLMAGLLVVACAISVAGYSLSDYPYFFVHNGEFDPVYVIGTESPSLDVVSATIISTGITRYNLTPKVATTRLDEEVGNIRKYNAIVIGSPCVNSVAAELEGNPEPCDAGLEGSTGYIKFFESEYGKIQILITGLSGEDRRAAAEYLARHDMSGVTGRIKSVDSGSGSRPGEGYEEFMRRLREKNRKNETKNETTGNKTLESENENVNVSKKIGETNKAAKPNITEHKEDEVSKVLEQIRERRARQQEGGLLTRFFRAIWRFLKWLF